MVINCLKCYRVHKCGDGVYYCPFFGINPCQRGKHVVVLPELNIKRKEKAAEILDFLPLDNRGRTSSPIPWEKYHNKIFTMLRQGMTIHSIAKEMGIAKATLDHYVDRY